MSDNSNNTTTPVVPVGDFAQALRGEIKLSVGTMLQRAWDITLRSLPWMLGVFVVLFLINMLLSGVLSSVFPFDEEAFAAQESIDWEQLPIGNILASSLLQELIMAPFAAMLVYIGLVNAADKKPSISGLRKVLQYAPQVVLVALCKLLITGITAGLVVVVLSFISGTLAVVLTLLVIIYIQITLMLSVPFVIDRELNAFRAIMASFLVINKAMFPVLGLMLLMGIIILISAIPLFLGLIFTLPMAFNAVGVVYHSLIGVDTETL